MAHFRARALEKDIFYILDIMQVTFFTMPIVDLPSASLNSKGVGHMPTQFQL